MERLDLKRILEITLGVFIGALGALMVVETWHGQKEAAIAEAAKVRAESQAQARHEEAETLKGVMKGRAQPAAPAAPTEDDAEDTDIEDDSNTPADGVPQADEQDSVDGDEDDDGANKN